MSAEEVIAIGILGGLGKTLLTCPHCDELLKTIHVNSTWDKSSSFSDFKNPRDTCFSWHELFYTAVDDKCVINRAWCNSCGEELDVNMIIVGVGLKNAVAANLWRTRMSMMRLIFTVCILAAVYLLLVTFPEKYGLTLQVYRGNIWWIMWVAILSDWLTAAPILLYRLTLGGELIYSFTLFRSIASICLILYLIASRYMLRVIRIPGTRKKIRIPGMPKPNFLEDINRDAQHYSVSATRWTAIVPRVWGRAGTRNCVVWNA